MTSKTEQAASRTAVRTIILASASPRRSELLEQLGMQPVIAPADIDESTRLNESPSDYVLRLAHSKALAIAGSHADSLVIGADTTVVDDGNILGKPENKAHATAMLTSLSGREHLVHTGVSVVCNGNVESTIVTTKVTFRSLGNQEILDYVESGEPDGKAGAYAIQGLGAVLVERIEGSYSNVVGLPLAETASLLQRFGYGVLSNFAARSTEL